MAKGEATKVSKVSKRTKVRTEEGIKGVKQRKVAVTLTLILVLTQTLTLVTLTLTLTLTPTCPWVYQGYIFYVVT